MRAVGQCMRCEFYESRCKRIDFLIPDGPLNGRRTGFVTEFGDQRDIYTYVRLKLFSLSAQRRCPLFEEKGSTPSLEPEEVEEVDGSDEVDRLRGRLHRRAAG